VKNYFVYLPDDRAETAWECTATAAGYTRVLPGNDYPPQRHPMDHHFTWSKGRILDAYQIVFITEGTGWFESGRARRKYCVEAGTVFLLFPRVWHRYAPDAETGWVEHWIECRGRAFDRARELGLINPKRSVLRTGLDPDLLYCFERCHALAHRSTSDRQAALATLGLHILTLLGHAGTGSVVERQMDDAIQRAQLWIAEHYPEALNMQQLARELNVSYSWFRHAFRSRTGLSPKQYHVQMRLQKAQDFLANTAKSVKEIAAILGFDSPYHLSAQFKGYSGLAPDRWRRRLRRAV
jgi:AraC-like DNA-binding protein